MLRVSIAIFGSPKPVHIPCIGQASQSCTTLKMVPSFCGIEGHVAVENVQPETKRGAALWNLDCSVE